MQAEGTSSPTACVIDIMARLRQLEKEALRSLITQAFAIVRSHYDESIDLEAISIGYAPDYEASKLDEIEATVAPLAETLVNKVEGMVLPRRG